MKLANYLLPGLVCLQSVQSLVIPSTDNQLNFGLRPVDDDNEWRLIQLNENEARWVTEEQKLALKRQGKKFMDITHHVYLVPPVSGDYDSNKLKVPASVIKPLSFLENQEISYPLELTYQDDINPLLNSINTTSMRNNLATLSSFFTRYYKSQTGLQSSQWLTEEIRFIAKQNPKIKVLNFGHSWLQKSTIAVIPGKKKQEKKTKKNPAVIVVGAHQDSMNLILPSILAAPGADDDGSGTVTTLEAFRVLVESGFEPENDVEFHWYSAEEGGLLGSQDIFNDYAHRRVNVVAMLQQDMTGFIQKTLDNGKPEAIGVVTDNVHVGLTNYVKSLIEGYCAIPYVETQCGYACSDHASATRAGYPSAFVIESELKDSDPFVHTTKDTLDRLSFEHMAEHAKLTIGYAYELGMADF
ncbi:Zn-dependent exopeptidase [Nadsonia fulvescens var. elongata DSM 6958]|uniref:Peptide hydrolase n=1 Tax=Nadsonia fulvescens var. elongata DSM 6958 TaxID=857566 RepID=A0A1E3PEA6_9ASCO|nr:Zn-dependent exopeptidase [Nadsonia fulvescens var. elongata DSM 6958]